MYHFFIKHLLHPYHVSETSLYHFIWSLHSSAVGRTGVIIAVMLRDNNHLADYSVMLSLGVVPCKIVKWRGWGLLWIFHSSFFKSPFSQFYKYWQMIISC